MKKIFFAMMMFVSFQIFAERILSDSAYIRSAEASSTLSERLSGKEVVYEAGFSPDSLGFVQVEKYVLSVLCGSVALYEEVSGSFFNGRTI